MIAWAVEALIASALLMALVLAIRGPVRRAFGPDIAYALWALPVLRLLLPPLPAAWRHSVATPIAAAGERITVLFVGAAGDPVATAPAIAPATAIALLWAAGAAAFLAWHIVGHARFCRRMLARATRVDALAGGHVRVIESEACAGPLAFGIFRRTIAFPRDFAERYDAEERALAMAHELGHHLRGDLIANWFALAVLALHWFDPLAWRAFRAFRADQEMANDAAVLAGRPSALRHAYGRAIVKSAHGGTVSAACHLHTIHELKGRLKMLSTTAKSRRRASFGATTVALVSLLALGVTASGTQAAERIRSQVVQALPSPAIAPIAALQAPPPAPPPPAAEPAPAPVAGASRNVRTSTVTTPDGRTVRRVIVVHTDGSSDPAIDAAIDADMTRATTATPEMLARACAGGGSAQEFALSESDGKKRKVIFCTRHAGSDNDAPNAPVDTAGVRHDAIRSALDGVRSARSGIESDRNIPEAKRRKALAEIDKAIAQLEAQAAEHD